MPFESNLPEWNNPGQEPPEGIREQGWGAAEYPPADWFNWQWNTTYKVLQSLITNAIHKEEKGKPGGVAKIDSNGKVVDASGNPVEGAVKSVNNKTGTVTLAASDVGAAPTNHTHADVTTAASGFATPAMLNKLNGIDEKAEVNQNAFSNVKVGATTVSADNKADTLEIAAGANITITPDATNDKITIATTAQPNQNAFSNVKVGASTIVADSATDTLELVAGTNIVLTPDATNDKVTISTVAGLETTTGAQQKIDQAIANLINGAPGAMDTLNELAQAMGDDPNFATTVLNRLTAAEQNLAAHSTDTTSHITAAERTAWNAKETPTGAQTKADQALADAKTYTDTKISEGKQILSITAGEALSAGTPVVMRGGETKATKAGNLLISKELGMEIQAVVDNDVKVSDSSRGYSQEVAVEAIDDNRLLVVWITSTNNMYATVATLDRTTGKLNFTGTVYTVSATGAPMTGLKLKKMPNGDIVLFYMTGQSTTSYSQVLVSGYFTPAATGTTLTYSVGQQRYIMSNVDTDNRIITQNIVHVNGNSVLIGTWYVQTNTMYREYKLFYLSDYRSTSGTAAVILTLSGQDTSNPMEYGAFVANVTGKRYVATSWDYDAGGTRLYVFSMTGANYDIYTQESTLTIPSLSPLGIFRVSDSRILLVSEYNNDIVLQAYSLSGGMISLTPSAELTVLDLYDADANGYRSVEITQLNDTLYLYRNNQRRVLFSVDDKGIVIVDDFTVSSFSGTAGINSRYYNQASTAYLKDTACTLYKGYSTGSYGLASMTIKALPYTYLGLTTGSVSNGATANIQSKGIYTFGTATLIPGAYYTYNGTNLARTYKKGNAIGQAISATELLLF